MIGFLRRIRILIGVYYAYMLEYRAEIFLWAWTGILPFIMMGIWMQASAGGRFPLDPVEFARYFLTVFFVRQLTIVWVIWDFENEVVEGRLSNRLLQPLDPLWRYFSAHLAERLTRLPLLALLGLLFFVLYPKSFWIPSPVAIMSFLLVTLMAFLLRFAIQYTFAMLAFWTERATSLEQFWFLLYLFLSGVVAPLEVFPATARQIALITPFPYLVYFPAKLLVGQEVDLVKGIAVMVGWMAVFIVLNRRLWRWGLKQYSGMGA